MTKDEFEAWWAGQALTPPLPYASADPDAPHMFPFSRPSVTMLPTCPHISPPSPSPGHPQAGRSVPFDTLVQHAPGADLIPKPKPSHSLDSSPTQR